MRRAVLIALVTGLAAAPGGRAAAKADPAVVIHLPRLIRVELDEMDLGMIVVVQADDEPTLKRVTAIPMGRAPWSGEKMTLDRATLLARLASHGVAKEAVTFTGASEVVVVREEQTIKSEDLVEAAREFLEQGRPAPAGTEWQLWREPDALRIPAGVTASLRPEFTPHAVTGEVKVRVQVAPEGDDQALGGSYVVFRMAYPHRRLVATLPIPKGQMITAANTRVEIVQGDRPQPSEWIPPYGRLATRDLDAGDEVTLSVVRAPRPQRLVRRNDTVVLTLEGQGFRLRALGQALQDGYAGDVIRVRNVDSKRTVYATVQEDGTCVPVFDLESPVAGS